MALTQLLASLLCTALAAQRANAQFSWSSVTDQGSPQHGDVSLLAPPAPTHCCSAPALACLHMGHEGGH